MKILLQSIILLLPMCVYSQKDNLSLQLEIGKEYWMTTIKTETISQQIDGNDMVSINTETGKYSYRVIKVVDSAYILEARYKLLSQKVISGNDSSFHSSVVPDTADVASRIMHEFIDQPFEMTMTNSFVIKSIRNLDSVIYYALSKFPLTAEQLKYVMMQFEDEMTTLFANESAQMSGIYPSRSIKPNEFWTVSDSFEDGAPASDSTTYSVSEVGKDYILLSGSGTLRSIDKESNDENGVGTKYNLTGTEQCSYKLDRQSKWILEGKIISELRGYAEIKTDSIPAKTPMHIVTETIITGNSN